MVRRYLFASVLKKIRQLKKFTIISTNFYFNNYKLIR